MKQQSYLKTVDVQELDVKDRQGRYLKTYTCECHNKGHSKEWYFSRALENGTECSWS